MTSWHLNTLKKNWLSQAQKELWRWNKKYFPCFTSALLLGLQKRSKHVANTNFNSNLDLSLLRQKEILRSSWHKNLQNQNNEDFSRKYNRTYRIKWIHFSSFHVSFLNYGPQIVLKCTFFTILCWLQPDT